jgi:hypothetical protein
MSKDPLDGPPLLGPSEEESWETFLQNRDIGLREDGTASGQEAQCACRETLKKRYWSLVQFLWWRSQSRSSPSEVFAEAMERLTFHHTPRKYPNWFAFRIAVTKTVFRILVDAERRKERQRVRPDSPSVEAAAANQEEREPDSGDKLLGVLERAVGKKGAEALRLFYVVGGHTKREAARSVGCSESSFYRWEQGIKKSQLVRQFLGVDEV